ncbi:MAG: glycosyltransferase family 2 protein [Lachnospiraceae bacterium]|nr:glycosyltransferase family 2 protein [Lachnospiraceae bacterium]
MKVSFKENKELVSIIIPVHNAENFIKDTINCVRAQSYQNWELLLIEDGSTDHTMDVMDAYLDELKDERIRIKKREIKSPEEKTFGAARARNLGLSLAKGRYIAYLDADDYWVKDKLERELAFLKEKNAGFVFTGYEFGDENAKGTGKVVHVPETLNYKQALGNTTIFTSTVMMDTEKIEKSLMEMPYIKSEDTASWWKILKTGVTAYGLDENLVIYRRAGKSLSSNKIEALRRIWNLYRQAAGLSIAASIRYFVPWAYRAVKRRI